MFIVLIFLFVIFNTCLIYNVSSAIFGNSGNVKLNYDISSDLKIMPLSGETVVPLNVSYQVEGVFSKQAANFLSKRGEAATIDLRIKKTPKWCTARISPNRVTPSISSNWNSEESYIHVSFSEEAPAFVPCVIKIEMYAHEIKSFVYKVENTSKTAEISFTPDYLAIIDATLNTTYKEIKPGENTTFEIELENLGNAETLFTLTIDEIPQGWNATIPKNIKVGSLVDNDNNKKTIQLNIQTPKEPGYHNEIENIRVNVLGQYFGGLGESASFDLILQVRVRGLIDDSNNPIIDLDPTLIILTIVIAALIAIIIILALFIIKRF
jgi:uncharacterized membrane protein